MDFQFTFSLTVRTDIDPVDQYLDGRLEHYQSNLLISWWRVILLSSSPLPDPKHYYALVKVQITCETEQDKWKANSGIHYILTKDPNIKDYKEIQ